MGSVLEDLKKRRVFQWTAAYVAFALVALGVIGDVADTWEWSLALRQGLQLLLAFGLPLTILLAWFHGERGAQRVTPVEFGAFAALLGFLVLAIYVWDPAPTGPSTIEVVQDDRIGVALPRVVSEGGEVDAFAAGLHGLVIDELEERTDLIVPDVATMRNVSERASSLSEVADRVEARWMLDLSIESRGEDLAVGARLIDALGNENIMLGEFTTGSDVGGVTTMLENIVRAVAEEAGRPIEPTEPESSRWTRDQGAFDAYVEGTRILLDRSRAPEAADSFRSAVFQDPDFAEAHAALGTAIEMAGRFELGDRTRALTEAESATRSAVMLRPDSDEAWAARAWILMNFRYDWIGAQAALDSALAVDPRSMRGNWYSATLNSALGNHDRAIEYANIAYQTYAASAELTHVLGVNYYRAGLLDEALRHVRRSIPEFVGAFGTRSNILLAMDSLDLALESLLAEPPRSDVDQAQLEALTRFYIDAVRAFRETGQPLPRESIPARIPPMQPALEAQIYTNVGRHDLALDALEEGVRQRSPNMITINVIPAFAPLRDSTRFQALLDSMNLPRAR